MKLGYHDIAESREYFDTHFVYLISILKILSIFISAVDKNNDLIMIKNNFLEKNREWNLLMVSRKKLALYEILKAPELLRYYSIK